VTISNFTVATMERWLDAVTLRADTDPVKHMRLAAIQRCRPLVGVELALAWRDRADRYPDELVGAMVLRALDPDALHSWSAREALASRGDEIALHGLLVGVQYAVLNAVLAINRAYQPHRLAKWQRQLLSGLEVTPARLADRLHALAWAPVRGRDAARGRSLADRDGRPGRKTGRRRPRGVPRGRARAAGGDRSAGLAS